MEKQEKIIEELESDVTELIEKELESAPAILGINIGTAEGTKIASKFKKEVKMTTGEITAANSSLVFLSSKMLRDSLNQDVSYNLIIGKDKIVLSILTENITMISYLNRELADLEGLDSFIKRLQKLSLQITAIAQTSDILKEEIFKGLKRAIPNTLVLAIITKDGLPIKIQSTMPEPILSAMVAALYNLSGVLLESGMEYSIIGGENGSVIIHDLDENRVLALAVPESDERKLGSYIAKIKTIILKVL
jgi:predicted regulator of Ras-like GTPase activity (Roadblock/LC7/MglB family)